MRKHKLIELRKIIEDRIGSLIEEVEIATNVKLNSLYIADRKDEIEFLRWTATIINSILSRDVDRKQVQIGITKMRLELADTIEFENTLNKRIEELNLKLKESNNLRESDILINEIGCILGHLFNLKSDGDEAQTIEIRETNSKFQQTDHERKQLIKTEINAQI
jgi:hypothetical protein